jgi:hypothetical protein
MEQWELELAGRLEQLGEEDVRSRLNRGEYGLVGSNQFAAVVKWLDSKELERRLAGEAKVVAAAEAAHSVSREARALASEACREARRAHAIATIALMLSAAIAIAATIIALFK